MFFVVLSFHFFVSIQAESLCQSKVFCQGDLLRTVQMARIFPDSKTFVDLKMAYNEKTILRKFEEFFKKNPNRKQIKKFVRMNFKKYQEFDKWFPPDFTESPHFLQRIQNEEIKEFAQHLINIWPQLARKVKKKVQDSPSFFSLLPVPNGFIVPGGRFREFYYWDSYWIIKGLLLCDMHQTVKGMLDNFISMVQKYGFVPNGSRIYYLNRSQPPLLSLMVATYIDTTNDTAWLSQNIIFLEKEIQYFLTNKLTEVVKDGRQYHLAHYFTNDSTPRPESYSEDVKAAASLPTDEERRELFADLKSAAESGWDFSSRWIVDKNGGTNANLTFTRTRRIIPVDLNAFLCQAFRILSEFYIILQDDHRSSFWAKKSTSWQQSIKDVFYDEEDGIWYDWDNLLSKPRKSFYPSNFAPLWAHTYDSENADELGRNAAAYLVKKKILRFDGGIPTSLIHTGEQWDYPNAWPPLQSMVILGLDQTGNAKARKIAQVLAKKWIESNLVSFYNTGKMFEKYSVEYRGQSGKGGEYSVQTGFGWTNGVLLELIKRYYTKAKRK